MSDTPWRLGRPGMEDMEPEERRALRSDAVYHAALLHGETHIEEYMRSEKIESVLKTAEALYAWVINDG